MKSHHFFAFFTMTVLLKAHSITIRVAKANKVAVSDIVLFRPILSTRNMVRTVPGNSAKVVQIKLTKSESVKLLIRDKF